MPFRLIPLDEALVEPWRNGGGTTRTLFTWPATNTWQLRISVAEIQQDGPFSTYAGVDRWIAVVQGTGVQLNLPEGPQRLTPDSPPLAFAGEAAPACALLAGPTRDLNLMVQRAAGSGWMQRVQPGQAWASTARLRGMFSAEALTLQIDDGSPVAVPAWTLAVATLAAGQRWLATGPAAPPQAWWLSFEAHGA